VVDSSVTSTPQWSHSYLFSHLRRAGRAGTWKNVHLFARGVVRPLRDVLVNFFS